MFVKIRKYGTENRTCYFLISIIADFAHAVYELEPVVYKSTPIKNLKYLL